MIALQTVTNSTQIAAFAHDPAINLLVVQFKGRGDKPGPVYHVRDVDEKKADAFRTAPSMGAFYNAHIKGQHEYERIDTEAMVDGEGSDV